MLYLPEFGQIIICLKWAIQKGRPPPINTFTWYHTTVFGLINAFTWHNTTVFGGWDKGVTISFNTKKGYSLLTVLVAAKWPMAPHDQQGPGGPVISLAGLGRATPGVVIGVSLLLSPWFNHWLCLDLLPEVGYLTRQCLVVCLSASFLASFSAILKSFHRRNPTPLVTLVVPDHCPSELRAVSNFN